MLPNFCLVLQVPHLQRTLPSSEVALQCFQEGAVVVLDLMFGIYINIIRIKCAASAKGSAEEEPLLHDVDLEDGLNDSQEIASSFSHCMTCNNIHPVLEQGVKKQLDFQDLLPLPPDMNPSLCHNTLRMSWEAQQITNCSNASLLKAIWSAYGWPYFCLGLLKVCNDCIGFAGPLLLNKLIRFLQKGGRSRDGIGLAISLGLVALLKSCWDTQYTYRLSKLKLRLRSSIMMMIYEKCLHVTLVERSIFSEGEIQTFMSVDADRTVNLFNSLHDVWSLPLQISIALYLLYTQVNFAFLSGVAVTVLLIPGESSSSISLYTVNQWISNLVASATEKMMKQKDERQTALADSTDWGAFGPYSKIENVWLGGAIHRLGDGNKIF